jgi:hypothetical protein
MGLLAIAPMLLVILADQPAAYARDIVDDTPASTEGLPPDDALGTPPSEIASSDTFTPPAPSPTTRTVPGPRPEPGPAPGDDQQGGTAPQLSHLMLPPDAAGGPAAERGGRGDPRHG